MLKLLRLLFRQILPVIPGANRAEVIKACMKSSPLWASFEKTKLVENVRLSKSVEQSEARDYDNWLLDVGNGICPNAYTVNLPKQKTQLIEPDERHSGIMSAVHWVYDDSLQVNLIILRFF